MAAGPTTNSKSLVIFMNDRYFKVIRERYLDMHQSGRDWGQYQDVDRLEFVKMAIRVWLVI